ncbi:MAG: ParA family protein [Pirellulaceae bacterium]
MPILMFINLKGGVAKTTNAVAVAECLASVEEKRVLLIDADHQCTAGEMLLGERRLLRCEHRKVTLHDMLAAMLDDEFEAEQVAGYIEHNVSNIEGGLPNLSVLPCSVRIDDFQTNMAKARRGYQSTEEFLGVLSKRRRAIQTWLTRNYDYTIIDCPPSIALQVRLFLTIANSYIVPSVPDRLSVRGSFWLVDRLRRAGAKVRGLGTLWSLYRQQNAVHRRTIDCVQKGDSPYHVLPKPFCTVIPNAAAIAAATEDDLHPHSFTAKYTPAFAKMYRNLSQEIIDRCQA